MTILQANNNNFIRLSWKDVRKSIHKLNPELANIIDSIDPPKDHTLYKATYQYGSELLKKGNIHFPNAEGRLFSISDAMVENSIKEDLSYNYGTNPACMILKNSAEVYTQTADRLISLFGMITPGSIFSTSLVLNPHKVSNCPLKIWDISAGARSIFMIQKISEKAAHSKLKSKFYFQTEPPKTLKDQWHVFRSIANSRYFGNPWEMEMIFFGKKWFEHFDDDAWIKFYYYLYKNAWASSDYWRNEFMWSPVYSMIDEKRNIKPSTYVLNTAKHILAMSIGAAPGFGIATDDLYAPINYLSEAYKDIYQLKGYPPKFLAPMLFNSNENNPLYYSINFPTSIEFSRKSRERSSLITDLCEIRSLINTYTEELLNENFKVDELPLYKAAKTAKIEYFHSDVEEKQYYETNPNSYIPLKDENLPRSNNNIFPVNSIFFRACIRLSM